MKIEPEISGASLVMLGDFNPSIFTPSWFAWRGLLPTKVVDAAVLKIAHPDITRFEADWLNLQIDRKTFKIDTSQIPFVRLRDLAVRIFREQLPGTPLRAMGINREVLFSVQSLDARDQLGRLLAPVNPWGDWGKKLEPSGNHGGMTSLTMTQVNLEDRPPGGQVNATVEPSKRIGQEGTGVYVRINDHYSAENLKDERATSGILPLLEKNFDKSLRCADQIINHIMSLTRD